MQFKVNTKAEFEEFICHNLNQVNKWIDEEQEKMLLPLTSSVDVRESKTKFAPVDHNMYPAGFNNLCSKDLVLCSERFKAGILKVHPTAKKIGLIPESHTKNKFYLDHLYQLKTTIENAGFEVTIISPDTQLFVGSNHIELESHSNFQLTIHQVNLATKTEYDVIVLNHDQSNPLPVNWSEVLTPVLPSPYVGWYKRQKNHHFTWYKKIADKFAENFEIDPDIISARFTTCENIDFNTKEGLEELGKAVDNLLKELPEDSHVFVKASQGTYGMGISVVKSGEEIISMNRKVRNKMDVGKNNLKFTSVLVQEGIETIVKYDDAPAEVTIYLVNGRASGGFMRSNPLKGTQANLNSQGMIYQKLCLSDVKQDCDHKIKEAVYSTIARLSVLAASYEMKELMENV